MSAHDKTPELPAESPRSLAAMPGSRLPESPMTHQEAAWALLSMECKLILIQKAADKARRKHGSCGHHCDYRAALNSVADTSKFALEESGAVAKFYRDAGINAVIERDALREKIGNLYAVVTGDWESKDAFVARIRAILFPENSKDSLPQLGELS